MSTISVKDMQGDIRRFASSTRICYLIQQEKKNNNGTEIGIERLRIFQCH